METRKKKSLLFIHGLKILCNYFGIADIIKELDKSKLIRLFLKLKEDY